MKSKWPLINKQEKLADNTVHIFAIKLSKTIF
jgi:hypothetical protein